MTAWRTTATSPATPSSRPTSPWASTPPTGCCTSASSCSAARSTTTVANRLCAQLLLLSAEDPRGDISLYINSPGGSVSAGLAIYDTMRLIPNDVSTLAMGLAGSMGQFLLSAGTPGKRFSLPHAQILMHQGSAGFGGTAADIEIQAEQLSASATPARPDRRAHRPAGRDDRARQPRDRWFTAEEARAYGLIDHIVDAVDDVRPRRSHGARVGGERMSSYTIPTVVEQTPTGERAYRHLLAGCSPSGSSSSAPRSTTAWPTW